LLCFDPESSADEKLIACVLNDSWFSADFSRPFHCTLFAPNALVQSFVALRSPSDNHEWSAVAPLNGYTECRKARIAIHLLYLAIGVAGYLHALHVPT
jgi:hypothetical protein